MKSYKDMYDEARLELTASQAREKDLRDALAIADHALRQSDDDWENEVELRAQIAVREALAQPTDDTALRAALASEFAKGYERGCSGYHEGLKIALKAERERCRKHALKMSLEGIVVGTLLKLSAH